MAGERYSMEFKLAAVKQVPESAYSIAEIAKHLCITTKSLYNWCNRYDENTGEYQERQSPNDELTRLKTALKHNTKERDIPREAMFFASESKKNTHS